MGHEWVFDVLKDLVDYAERNDLPRLAAKAEEALMAAQAEIGRAEDDPGTGQDAPGGRVN
ncbi:MAG: hypothetical protein RLZZ563_2272 [Pseudomonadota bacterium]|jgi:hypothetical protein